MDLIACHTFAYRSHEIAKDDICLARLADVALNRTNCQRYRSVVGAFHHRAGNPFGQRHRPIHIRRHLHRELAAFAAAVELLWSHIQVVLNAQLRQSQNGRIVLGGSRDFRNTIFNRGVGGNSKGQRGIVVARGGRNGDPFGVGRNGPLTIRLQGNFIRASFRAHLLGGGRKRDFDRFSAAHDGKSHGCEKQNVSQFLHDRMCFLAVFLLLNGRTRWVVCLIQKKMRRPLTDASCCQKLCFVVNETVKFRTIRFYCP